MAEDSDGRHDAASEGPPWDGLQSAVRRVGGGESEGGEFTRVDDDEQPSAEASEPELLPEDRHQTATPRDHEAGGPTAATQPTPGGVAAGASSDPDAASGGIGMDAPESDEEAPLGEHIEEMVTRLGIVVAIAALVSIVVFPVTKPLITWMWNYVLPGGEAIDPRVYQPLELIITQVKVASLAGLVVALPAFVYESYVFMRPGLYKNERRYYLASVPTSLVLSVVGVLFAFFIVLPYTMGYFQSYTEPTADVAFALGTTFNLLLLVMGYLAVVFQIPLFIMLAIMLGVTTREWLESRRLLFWGAFAGIAFTFSAIDPTGIVPVIVAITMVVLFEGTLALLRWTGN